MRISFACFLGLIGCMEEKAANDDALWDEDDLVARYGPANNWYHTGVSTVQDSGECGYNEGQQACNFTMVDQNGDDVELYQFWGQVIVLDVFAEW